MSNFTPGPWTHRNGRIFQTDYEQLTIANVGRAFDGGYSPANGDLLADAPALLDALEMCVTAFNREASLYLMMNGEEKETPAHIAKSRALIAKHRGGV